MSEKENSPSDYDEKVLVVLDKKMNRVDAFTKIGEDNSAERTEATSKNQSRFLRIDDRSSMLKNFINNWTAQYKDPTQFQFFSVPIKKLEQIVKYIKSLLDPPTSEKTEKILEQYRINPDEMKESETLDQSHLTSEEQKEANALKYTFTEKEINWSQLQPYGITPELLEEHNCMGALLKGRKSPCVLPFNAMMGNVKVETVGRIAFRREQDGNVTLVFHGVRKTPELDKPFFGHVFTKEDREALLETGNLGRLVPLLNPQTNEKSPCYVSLDKLTNEIIAHRAEFVSTPKTIKGVTLTNAQYADLKSGKSIFVKGMTAESGVTFNADIQFNADKRGLEFTFESNKLKESQTGTNRVLVHQKIGGVQLTKEQQTDIAAGKTVFVEGLKNKQGKIYSAYVVKNDEKDKLDFYSKNPNDLKQGEKQKKSKGVK